MSLDQISIKRPSFISNKPQEDILRLLDDLDELVSGTQTFFGRAWGVQLDDFHMLINKVRASLPDEVRRANLVANDSNRIVAAAKEEAEIMLEQAHGERERILEEARQTAAKLIDTSEINRLAKAQAQDIMASAETSARDIRRGADEYARDVLTAIENHLAKVMGTIQKGREKLDVRISSQEPSEPMIPMGRGIRR